MIEEHEFVSHCDRPLATPRDDSLGLPRSELLLVIRKIVIRRAEPFMEPLARRRSSEVMFASDITEP